MPCVFASIAYEYISVEQTLLTCGRAVRLSSSRYKKSLSGVPPRTEKGPESDIGMADKCQIAGCTSDAELTTPDGSDRCVSHEHSITVENLFGEAAIKLCSTNEAGEIFSPKPNPYHLSVKKDGKKYAICMLGQQICRKKGIRKNDQVT